MSPEIASHAPLRTFISPDALPIWMEGIWPSPRAKEAFQEMLWYLSNRYYEREILLFRDGYWQLDNPLEIIGVWNRIHIDQSLLVVIPISRKDFVLEQCVPLVLTPH